MSRKSFTAEEARRVGEQIGIDWSSTPFDVDEFRAGMDVELEHGAHDLSTNVTDDDAVVTGKIALAISTSSRTTTSVWRRWRKRPERESDSA